MDQVRKKAYEILDIIQKIYQIQESNNPSAIFKDKIFLIGKEDNRQTISIERDFEDKDCSYYFDASDIHGVIIKKESGGFCIKAAVRYLNSNNEKFWLAKIRIENSFDGYIKVMGKWGGSWQKPDYEDENLLINLSPDFLSALDSMKIYMTHIYNQLCQSKEVDSDLYDPKWVKKLKKYNN